MYLLYAGATRANYAPFENVNNTTVFAFLYSAFRLLFFFFLFDPHIKIVSSGMQLTNLALQVPREIVEYKMLGNSKKKVDTSYFNRTLS